MLLVTAFRLGERQQNLALLAASTTGQIAIDGGFGTFIGQILTPPTDVCVARHRGGCGVGFDGVHELLRPVKGAQTPA